MDVGAEPVLHRRVDDAARGVLPDWSVVDPGRRRHMERVAELMAEWADVLGLSSTDRDRWVAAAFLHDALRDAPPAELRRFVPPAVAALPGQVLHGPACAERLRVEGVKDGALLLAISQHTVGHPHLDTLGLALFAADFLEPGRSFLTEWRAEIRGRMPGALETSVKDILRVRLQHVLERGLGLLPDTVAFWNRFAGAGEER
ncbi:MAG: HD domain-containing protein [Gemmatimonadota bacterium]|nr:HD domain-containing protein [Gemmatimonadota bacterium]MDH5760011.1 HD domain-containing protein [Gemmatimonadota bacterium]